MIVIYKSGEFIYYHYNNERQLGRLRAILKNANNEYRLRIQEVVSYDNLPEIFKGRVRQERSIAGEVWLKDEAYQTIAISQVLEKANVMIVYQHQYVPETALRITEIIYRYQSRWHIRNVIFSYQHPSDYITLRLPPSSLPVYKLFIDLYYDDFGTYRNVYHSLGGIYLQFGNMPSHERKLLKN
ncbi:hypothetical protein RclHR1_40880001, partial [Rhizophagus clarus]